MKATVVTIGDEILIGQIVDTNSSFIAKSLNQIGIEVNEMLSISDDKKHILDTLLQLQNKVNLVIITGGLGPTKDDITKKTLTEYFEDTLVVNEDVLNHVTQLIEQYFKRPITQLNKDQALVPSKCEVLFNQVGTAPGMWMEKEGTVFVSLPGVPFEMKHLIENEVIPRLIKKYDRPFIIHKTLLTYGVGESLLAERIEEWEDALPDFIKLAYLPSPGSVRLRMTARGKDEDMLEKVLAEKIALLEPQIQDCLVGLEEDDTLQVVLGKLLVKENLTIATAESCTGGKIASVLTSVSGASAYFRGSVVSYATVAKEDVLGISNQLIQEYSVVSTQIAEAMALSVQKLFKTDFAIAVTGNAGPLKGDSNAEVGTVFISIATPKEVFTEEFNFGQPREKVIDRAVNKGLELVYKEILKNYKK
ncbi:CinA family nicotinamide mononucleotide deamidase-related protein [Flavobacterium terrae]|uniref:CinA-like protein n=1 Tax=Flavobacterium terrae TaxID=415425 RepID=A0A1M6CXG7_9FLAO|nr:CinA family nicotinamide mononucleotide deamidase-related protein [Flavobacterium terrae]SHI65686.1 nicotinamide-nucleotide amidase [Flavobacterium terrae]